MERTLSSRAPIIQIMGVRVREFPEDIFKFTKRFEKFKETLVPYSTTTIFGQGPTATILLAIIVAAHMHAQRVKHLSGFMI